MTDNPSLRDVLAQLAAEVHPVDLSDRVARSRRRLYRQRATAAGLAGVAVIGAGGFAFSQAPLGDDVHQAPGGTSSSPVTFPAPPVAVTATCCVPSGATLLPTPAASWESGFFGYTPLPATASAANSAPPNSGVTARPPSATPTEVVPTGHGCASPWTDESSGNGSPFASSAQREAAAAMGTALCSHVGQAKVTRLVEWVSMGGLNHVGEGVTYDVQATGSGVAVYLEVFHRPETTTGTSPVVTTESGALRAQWPDGTVVLMTKGEDSAATRSIITDPAFDVFHG